MTTKHSQARVAEEDHRARAVAARWEDVLLQGYERKYEAMTSPKRTGCLVVTCLVGAICVTIVSVTVWVVRPKDVGSLDLSAVARDGMSHLVDRQLLLGKLHSIRSLGGTISMGGSYYTLIFEAEASVFGDLTRRGGYDTVDPVEEFAREPEIRRFFGNHSVCLFRKEYPNKSVFLYLEMPGTGTSHSLKACLRYRSI